MARLTRIGVAIDTDLLAEGGADPDATLTGTGSTAGYLT